MNNISILIPFGERLNSYYGGAVARWVNEVYSRVDGDCKIKVYGRVCNDKNDYKSINVISKYNAIFNFITRVPYIRRSLFWLYCRLYYKNIKESSIIEVHNSYQYIHILRKMGFKGKIILHMHNDYLGFISREYLENINSNIDLLVTCSDFLRQRIKNKSEELYKKSITVYNGFDENLFFPKNKDATEELSIGYVGRIDFNKGLHLLLDVYERLLIRIPDLKLLIIGSSDFGKSASSYEKMCKEKVNKLQKEKNANIDYIGYVHNEKLVNYYNKFTLFCSFSLQNEAFGMTYIEAMACKIPVLANNIGGVKEAVNFDKMLVNNIDNLKQVEEKAYGFLINKELSATMSNLAYDFVQKNFKWSTISDKKLKILIRLL